MYIRNHKKDIVADTVAINKDDEDIMNKQKTIAYQN